MFYSIKDLQLQAKRHLLRGINDCVEMVIWYFLNELLKQWKNLAVMKELFTKER